MLKLKVNFCTFPFKGKTVIKFTVKKNVEVNSNTNQQMYFDTVDIIFHTLSRVILNFI